MAKRNTYARLFALLTTQSTIIQNKIVPLQPEQIDKSNDIMTAITINIPNHEVSFFKKMISKMGWSYSEANVVRSAATPKEKTLAKVDHAFAQLRQMKDGELQGINAEELLNEL